MPQESDFDAYYKWLGIPPQHQPPDHYRLLGLETFESDAEVIRAAAERQMAHVQNYKIGPRSDLSQKLLNEIAKARICLLDPASKGEYDRSLGPHLSHVLASQPVGPGTAPAPVAPLTQEVVPPSPVSSVPGSTGVEIPTPSFRARSFYRRRKRSPSAGMVIAICFLIFMFIGVVVAVYADLPSLMGPTKGTETRPPIDGPKAEPRRTAPRRAPPKPQPSRPLRKKEPQDNAKPWPRPNRNGKFPVPNAAQIEKAKAAIHIDGVLTPQEFLEAANDADHPWMRYVLYQMTIDAAIAERNRNPLVAARIGLQAAEKIIELYDVKADAFRTDVRNRLRPDVPPGVNKAPQKPARNAAVAIDNDTGIATVELPDRNVAELLSLSVGGKIESLKILSPSRTQVEFSIDAAPGGHSCAIAYRGRSVAQISHDGSGDLRFSWAEGVSVDAEYLRNAILVVEGNSTPIALRKWVEIEAPLINLSSRQITVPLHVPLWGLNPKDLRIEAVGLSNMPVRARYPANGRAKHRDPARLVVRDEPPKGGMELSLHGTAPLQLQIKPVLEHFDGKLHPWTKERMKNLEGAYTRRISACQNDIRGLQRTIPNLEAQLAALNKQYHPQSLIASLVKAQINRVTAARDAAKRQLADLERTLPILNRQVQGFGELDELTEGIDQRTRVAFRVFYVVAGHEVTVLRTE